MRKTIIQEILSDEAKSTPEKVEIILNVPLFKKESFGSSIAREIIGLSIQKINNDNQGQISQLIADMIEVKINKESDDDSHRASRAFLEAGIFNAEELLEISSKVITADPFMGTMPGMDRIIRYLCGLKN